MFNIGKLAIHISRSSILENNINNFFSRKGFYGTTKIKHYILINLQSIVAKILVSNEYFMYLVYYYLPLFNHIKDTIQT